MSLQIFLRRRGLFVKFLLTYVAVCGAAIAIVGAIDVQLADGRLRNDVRTLFAGIDGRFFETTTRGVDLTDPVACRERANAVFWRVVERGTGQVSDFAAMLSYFATGQLHVVFASEGRALCASSPGPSPLLAKALSRALESPSRETLLREGSDWAVVARFEPGGTAPQIFIGVHYLPEWTTGPTLPYDLLRTVVFVSVLGVCFGTVWIWLLLRRIERATQAADRWASGNLSARIRDSANDEISALAERFNRMADALARTIQTEKTLSVSMERQRIARDLHDTAKQRSFVLGLKLTELEHDAQGQGALLQIVGEARRLADHLQQDLVDAVSGFSLPVVSELGLREALTRNVDDLLVGSAIEWTLDLPGEVEVAIAPLAAQELLMITHEAVANALRHSGCHRILVSCQAVAEARWRWGVEDDGTGFDPRHAPAGMGLANLRWRASALPEGEFVIRSDSTGTRIEVTFTLQTREIV
ncbi:HAMP domain-containing protein [Steroidobacter flavus]|uniref:HAMP domain-containing protein n=1 Tax=Steroidobacter flavus TaxID=1842136 RepID=A0ABV8T2J2_9GAMM